MVDLDPKLVQVKACWFCRRSSLMMSVKNDLLSETYDEKTLFIGF